MSKKSDTTAPLFVEAFPHASHDFYKPLAADLTTISDWAPSLARQEFAEDCDINTIMARYEKTGVIPPGVKQGAEYVDWYDMPDNLMDTLAQLKDAESQFMTLPASIRRTFDNSALEFVDFAANPANLDQMRSWGLAKPAEPEKALAPSPAPSSSESAPPASPAAK